jgi:hypothetical protein
MTDKYPMALYPPKGEMLIVNNEQEHADALDAHWEKAPPPDYPPPIPAAIDDAEPEEDGPEVLDEAGVPIKRGPGRPRRVIP